MRNYSNLFKRTQAWILALAIMLMSVGPALCFGVFATEAENTKTSSDGKIVAGNYDLTAAEKAILSSGLLIGESHTYEVPTSAEDLISVDESKKEVTVKSYEGTSGYEWKPVSVKIVVGEEVKETVNLDSKGKGTYTYNGNAFSVKVDYELRLDVDTATQETLLNTPAYLVQGLENLKDIASVADELALIEEQAMDTLYKLVTTGISVTLFGNTVSVKIPDSDATNVPAIKAIKELNTQTKNNDGKFDLSVMIAEYNASASKLQYLFENGEAMKAAATEMYNNISSIKNSDFFKNQIPSYANLGGGADAVKLNGLIATFNSIVDGLEAPVADSWNAINETILSASFETVNYIKLEQLVNAVANLTDVDAIEIKNPLVVDSVTLQYNMSMWNVDVEVVLNVTDASSKEVKFYEYAGTGTTVTLADGATAAEIEQAVADTNLVKDFLDANAGVYVEGKFDVTTTELPDTLGKDIKYVITYTPAYFDVDFAYGNTVEYPYGYVVELEKHDDAKQAYDYTVNGKYYPQGTRYTIVGDTEISREVGKAYNESDLYKIVANNYLTTESGASILTSGALLGNVAVNVRYPDNNNKHVVLVGNTLTAQPYDASYEGLFWAAYSYTLSSGTVGYFNSASSVEINEEFDSVIVEYRLYLTNFESDDVLDIANIPYVLVTEAKAQKTALDRIANQQGNLEQLNSTTLVALSAIIGASTLNDDPAKDAALKECFSDVLDTISAECMDGNNLYLYGIVGNYKAEGLKYYYLNSDKVVTEISKFAELMNGLVGDSDGLASSEKITALEILVTSAGVGAEYVEKLTRLETTMNEVVAGLTAPNALIDRDSANLGKLTDALEVACESNGVKEITKLGEALHLSDKSIVVKADNKVVITVTVTVPGGKTETFTSPATNYGATITAATINDLLKKIDKFVQAEGVAGNNAKYYSTDYSVATLRALIGTVAGVDTVDNYSFNWTYKQFEVNVPGAATQFVTLVDREIKLPVSTSPEYRIVYTIDGVEVTTATYKLTDEQLDKLIAGNLEITVENIFVLEEDLTNFVNKLNASVGNNKIVFALVENNGAYSIVMKVDASAPASLMSSVQGAAMGMVQGGYSYIGVGESALLDNGMVHLQAIIDALMNSGFGSDTIVNVMDSNGKINNMTLSGKVISDKALTTYGGKLVETTMQLGTNASQVTNVPFYITLGAAGSEFVQVRNLLAGQISNYFSFECVDGKAAISLTLPQKAYEAFLAVLLVTDNIDITDINAVNGEIVTLFFDSLIRPVLEGETTVATFENTLKKFGFDLNLSSINGLEGLFKMLKKFYTDAELTFDENGGAIDGNLDISGVIASLNLGALSSLIAEKDSGLDICIDASLTNIGNEYEALYVDYSASGITNKVGLVKDLKTQLNKMAGTAVVVLLSDVDADLTFKTTTVLNLNGFKVTGDIVGSGNVIIVDSYLDQDKVGTVDGNISGNVSIVSGKYTADVTEFIKSGYVQDADGVVANEFYDIIRDADGNVTVELDAGILYTSTMPGIRNLVIDLVCDLLFNGYTYNYLAIDGNLVYDISVDDLVGLYAGSNRVDTVIEEVMGMVDSAQLSALINTVLDDVLDFNAIGNAIANDVPVLSYDMTVKNWNVEIVRVDDGDYITVNIASHNEKNGKLNFVVTGTSEDKQLLADLMKELGNTTDADVNVNITHNKDNKDLMFGASADADIFVDLSNPNYAVMFSVIIADGIGAPANAALISGIKTFYATNNIAALKEAFYSLTSAQIITALKNLGVNDDFTDMVKALGLDDVVGSEVAELEALYDRIGKLAAAVVRKADLTGRNGKISSYLNAEGYYDISRENIDKLLKTVLAGYTVSAELEITSASFALKLFGDDIIVPAPEFVEGTGTPDILESDKVAGYKVVYDGMYLVIDAHANGLTVAELMNLLKFNVKNADSIGYTLGDGTLAMTDLVANGTTLTVVATNAAGSASVEYTIIILGDVNCNGRIESGDAMLIAQIYTGIFTAPGVHQTLAADVSDNGRLESGDAVLIARKYVDWDNYTTSLKKDQTEA